MLLTALILPLLSSCAIDKGTALAANFSEDWAGTPDVAKIDTTRNNTLPFAGTASGTLVLKEGTPPGRVSELAGDLRRYVDKHRNVTGRIAAGGVTFTVVADQGRADEVLALWRSLTADERTRAGDIHDASLKQTRRWRVELTAADAAAAMTLFQDVRRRPTPDVLHLEVRTARDVRPGLFVGTDFHGKPPTEAIAAYEAVTARHAVTGASLRPDRMSIVVADGADRESAHELARKAAPGFGDALKVTGAP